MRTLGFALTAVWVSNTAPRPPAKRSAAIGIVNGIGNIGNLYVPSYDKDYDFNTLYIIRIGTFIWKEKWGPEYHPSMFISLAALLFSSLLALSTSHMLLTSLQASAFMLIYIRCSCTPDARSRECETGSGRA